MNLKESFMYQNMVDSLIVLELEKLETVSKESNSAEVSRKITENIFDLLDQKEKIYYACRAAKNVLKTDIDIAKAMNIKRRQVITLLMKAYRKNPDLSIKQAVENLEKKSREVSFQIELSMLTSEVDYAALQSIEESWLEHL